MLPPPGSRSQRGLLTGSEGRAILAATEIDRMDSGLLRSAGVRPLRNLPIAFHHAAYPAGRTMRRDPRFSLCQGAQIERLSSILAGYRVRRAALFQLLVTAPANQSQSVRLRTSSTRQRYG